MEVLSKAELSEAVASIAERTRDRIDGYHDNAISKNQVQEAIAKAFEDLAEELSS